MRIYTSISLEASKTTVAATTQLMDVLCAQKYIYVKSGCTLPPLTTHPDRPESCCEKATLCRVHYTQLCHRLRPLSGGCDDQLSLCRCVFGRGGKTVCQRYDGVNQSFPRLAETSKRPPLVPLARHGQQRSSETLSFEVVWLTRAYNYTLYNICIICPTIRRDVVTYILL